jgi:hypothetical protein
MALQDRIPIDRKLNVLASRKYGTSDEMTVSDRQETVNESIID